MHAKMEREGPLDLVTCLDVRYSFTDSLGWLVFMILGFFNFNPSLYHQLSVIDCQRFDYGIIVFKGTSTYTMLGILLKVTGTSS